MQDFNQIGGNYEQCLKCDICTTVCPMMAADPHYPGPKLAGPDGTGFRVKDPEFYNLTLRFCVNCKRCEVACPSGVKVSDLIQQARSKYGGSPRPVRDRILADPDLTGKVMSSLAPLSNRLMSSAAARPLMRLAGLDPGRKVPEYASRTFEDWFRHEAASAQDAFPSRISYFHGCYVNYNYPELGMDMVRILNACGYGVSLLDGERCCGVALMTSGLEDSARRNAEANVAAIRRSASEVLTTGATCALEMRDEYPGVMGLDCADASEKVTLATKWLYERVEAGDVRLAFKEGCGRKVVYHTSCHMNRLGWRVYPVGLLRMIPGMVVSVPFQRCCGMAGTFGFKSESRGLSEKMGAELFETLQGMAPDVVVTECETCKWQIESATGLKVMNPVSLLAECLDFDKTKELNA